MKRQMFFATVFSAALAAGVAAQTGAGTPPQSGQDKAKNEVTVTGCLTPADSAGTSGTSGTATSGSSARGQFILTNATVSGGAASTGTSGAATGAAPAAGDRYRLVGKTEELKDNVNAKVEVKGMIDRAGSSSSAGSSAGTGATASGAQKPENLPALRVTSVRKIADSCQ